MVLCRSSHVGPIKPVRTRHAYGLAFAPGLDGQPHHGIPLEWSLCEQLAKLAERGSPQIPWVWSSYIGHLFVIGGGLVAWELIEFRKIGLFGLSLPQGSILQSSNNQTQGWIHLLGLMPVFHGNAGDLLIVLHWVQDMQIAALCLYGTCWAFEGSFLHGPYCHSCDPEVSAWVVSMGQDTLDKASALILVLPAQ